jgi:hypothetical protein
MLRLARRIFPLRLPIFLITISYSGTFHPRSALSAAKPVKGHRTWKEFKGDPFDPNEFQKADGYRDHEHCSICWFRIVDGHTYWQNADAVKILCDACYEEYQKT